MSESPDVEQPSEPKLTVKQRRFADFYLGDARFNASEAARLAGYKHHYDQSWDLLNSPNVSAYITAQLKAKSMPADGVLAELTEIAAAEWREFVHVKSVRGGDVEVEMDLGAKVKSLELLGKAHKLFTEKVQHSGSVDIRRELVGVDPDDL